MCSQQCSTPQCAHSLPAFRAAWTVCSQQCSTPQCAHRFLPAFRAWVSSGRDSNVCDPVHSSFSTRSDVISRGLGSFWHTIAEACRQGLYAFRETARRQSSMFIQRCLGCIEHCFLTLLSKPGPASKMATGSKYRLHESCEKFYLSYTSSALLLLLHFLLEDTYCFKKNTS